MPHPPELPTEALTYQTPIQFGMLYWVNFGYPTLPPGMEEKRILDWHPALVVSSDPFCRHAGAVNVVALTSYRGKLRPYHHLLHADKKGRKKRPARDASREYVSLPC